MAWIDIIEPADAEGKLKRLYRGVEGPGGQVDRVLKIHGLRPHTLEGHLGLYKATLHHPGNRLPKWLLEALGVYVSLLNGCGYCVEHHAVGLARNLRREEGEEEERAREIRTALERRRPEEALEPRHAALLRYAEDLTLRPAEMSETMVEGLRRRGWDDGEILEANQVVSYFNYVNRTVLGLGVDTAGEELGLSPSGDDFRHR